MDFQWLKGYQGTEFAAHYEMVKTDIKINTIIWIVLQ